MKNKLWKPTSPLEFPCLAWLSKIPGIIIYRLWSIDLYYSSYQRLLDSWSISIYRSSRWVTNGESLPIAYCDYRNHLYCAHQPPERKLFLCLWKIPNLGRNSCISTRFARETKIPQRWVMTICLRGGYIQTWGLSQKGAGASSPGLTSTLFFSSVSYSPANIFNYISCTSNIRKRALHPEVISVTFRNQHISRG